MASHSKSPTAECSETISWDSVEADDERQIAVADDWQLQRLAHSSSTDRPIAAPCPGDIGGPSEQACNKTRSGTSSQCSSVSSRCENPRLYFLVPVTIGAAAFRTR